MHVRRQMATLAASVVMLSACTSTPVQDEQSPSAIYPLKPCGNKAQRDCTVPFFAKPELIATRTPEAFPRRYLELWDAQVRAEECKDAPVVDICTKRLEQLDAYFNPDGPPDPRKIGVAL